MRRSIVSLVVNFTFSPLYQFVFDMCLTFTFCEPQIKTPQLLSARDQGLTAETCCAEESKINYQTEGFEGLSKKRSGKINNEGDLCIALELMII